MSNQYELPRAVGPQRRISSRSLRSEMVAALKFTHMAPFSGGLCNGAHCVILAAAIRKSAPLTTCLITTW